MSNIIYWKQYDEPKLEFDPIMNVERKMNGEFVVSDERVANFGFVGTFNPNGPIMSMNGVFIFKDGSRHETEITVTMPLEKLTTHPDPMKLQNDYYISQAEQYLKELI